MFGDRNKWSSTSARYCLHEHMAARDGLKGFVYNSLFDKKEETDVSDLSKEEIQGEGAG